MKMLKSFDPHSNTEIMKEDYFLFVLRCNRSVRPCGKMKVIQNSILNIFRYMCAILLAMYMNLTCSKYKYKTYGSWQLVRFDFLNGQNVIINKKRRLRQRLLDTCKQGSLLTPQFGLGYWSDLPLGADSK